MQAPASPAPPAAPSDVAPRPSASAPAPSPSEVTPGPPAVAPASSPPAVASASASSSPVVELVAVTRRYGRLVALDQVTLSVEPGELVYLTGASEAGKSTLLRLVHGDLWPSDGRLSVAGVTVRHRTRRRRLIRLRRRVGAVFQDLRLLPDLTVRENVALALQVGDLWVSNREVRARAEARLAQVGLAERSRAYPHQLSGGQLRRLAVARALVREPAVLVADEPTTSLDSRAAGTVLDLLEQVAAAGTAVVVATHWPQRALRCGHRVVELRQGRVVDDTGRRAPR